MAMNNVELAKLLLAQKFTADQAKVMLAIAYVESSLNPNAEGDSANALNATGNINAPLAVYWCCPVAGKTDVNSAGMSIGLFQINLSANHDTVMSLSGINFATKSIGLKYPVPVNASDVCKLVTWLKNPANNVRTAKSIFDGQGLTAWSAYKSGDYLAYMPTATTAVNTALTPAPVPNPPPSPIPGTPYTVGVSIAMLGIAAAVFGISYYMIKRSREKL